MKIKSITFKLFAMTALLFSVFLVLTLIGQSLFFERFYINRKISQLEKNIRSLTAGYSAPELTEQSRNTLLRDFTSDISTQIAVLDQDGLYKSLDDYYLVIETKDKKLVRVPLNNANNTDKLLDLGLTKGADIKLAGFYFDENKESFNMTDLTSGGKTWSSLWPTAAANGLASTVSPIQLKLSYLPLEAASAKIHGGKPSQTIAITLDTEPAYRIHDSLAGKINDLYLPKVTGFAAQYREEVLRAAVQNWLLMSRSKNISLSSREMIKYNFVNSINGEKSIVIIVPIFQGAALQETLLFLTPMQPVNEAVTALKDYYIYIFIMALVLLLFFSLLLSKAVSKPLLNIDQITQKMSELDFSEQLPIHAEDELGNLSRSINSLSGSLRKNIKELRHANEQLQLDIEKERQLEHMRKEFISGVSHELKTPISIISSYAEGIRDTVSEEKKEKYVDVILDESMKMNRLVTDMLDLSRLESGQRKLCLSNFHMDELAAKVLEKFCYNLEEKNIKATLLHPPENISVYGDEVMLEQVLTNLTDNAIKYSSQGSRLFVRLEKCSGQLKVSVENTGVRLPEEKIHKIWDRFYRLEESRDRKSGGTGLGLSIVKNILELHGFEYGACNTAQGVQFYFLCNLYSPSSPSRGIKKYP
jgi:two-component system sensor histidine kinase VanS